MKKTQAWSFDILIGIVIFLGVMFLLLALFFNAGKGKDKQLQQEAALVLDQLANKQDVKIIEGNEINETKMTTVFSYSYDELRDLMRVDNEMCIYLEDEQGNVIFINSSATGKGSQDINVSGIPCAQ